MWQQTVFTQPDAWVQSPPRLSLVVIEPWSNGVGDAPYQSLSFPNALAVLLNKMDSSLPVLAFGIAAKSYEDFAAQCAVLYAALPLPQIQALQRKATAINGLSVSKMQLVDSQNFGKSVSASALHTVKAGIAQKLIADAQANVTAFKAIPATNHLTAFINALANNLQSTPTPPSNQPVWLCYPAEDSLTALTTGHPGHDFNYCAIIALQGAVS